MNGTAKMCLMMDAYFKSELKFVHWNQLQNIFMNTMLGSFVFYQKSFYFEMMKPTVDKLVDTGIMKYLLDNHQRKKYPEITEFKPKVFSLIDLDFGFVLYLGLCGLCTIAFLLEKVWYSLKSK